MYQLCVYNCREKNLKAGALGVKIMSAFVHVAGLYLIIESQESYPTANESTIAPCDHG